MTNPKIISNFLNQNLQKYHNSSNALIIGELGIKLGKNRAEKAIVSESLRSLDNADLGTTEISYGSQFRNLVIVNESGL